VAASFSGVFSAAGAGVADPFLEPFLQLVLVFHKD